MEKMPIRPIFNSFLVFLKLFLSYFLDPCYFLFTSFLIFSNFIFSTVLLGESFFFNQTLLLTTNVALRMMMILKWQFRPSDGRLLHFE